jgi:trehalose 6-phosphate phosphatase
LSDLPSALEELDAIEKRLSGKRPAVFLDYDGTLTPIVDRPDQAVLSDEGRAAVRALSQRCTVAIISGRDRPDVQRLVGLDDLVYAGSHGFDIGTPSGRSIKYEVCAAYGDVLQQVEKRLDAELGGIDGVLIEPKKCSIAVHYRLVGAKQAQRVRAVVDAIPRDHPDLRVTPGKKVWEIQPAIDWDKGKALLWLLEALDLDTPEVVPLYIGDDITDEDAFRVLKGRGIGIYVGHADDVEAASETAADYVVRDPDEVLTFLHALAN